MLARHSVLERVLRPDEGDLPADFARKLLSLRFDASDQNLYEELSEKAQGGNLTAQEEVALDDLLTANDVLMILQAKARISLNRAAPAA